MSKAFLIQSHARLVFPQKINLKIVHRKNLMADITSLVIIFHLGIISYKCSKSLYIFHVSGLSRLTPKTIWKRGNFYYVTELLSFGMS